MVPGASSIMMRGGAAALSSRDAPLSALNSNPSTSIFITKKRLHTEVKQRLNANRLLARMPSTEAMLTLWSASPLASAFAAPAGESAWPLPLLVLKCKRAPSASAPSPTATLYLQSTNYERSVGEWAEFKASAYMRMRPGRWLFNLRVTAILRALLGSASMHTLLKPFAAAASEMPPRLQPTSNNSPKLEVSSEQSPRAHTARRKSANAAM